MFQEDIIGKLVEFLIAPHATTTVLLAEKEKVSPLLVAKELNLPN